MSGRLWTDDDGFGTMGARFAMIRVARQDQMHSFEIPAFWEWARAGNLQSTDLVENTNGQFHAATAYEALRPLLPPPKANPLEGLLKVGLAVLGVVAVAHVVGEVFKPEKPRRRPAYLRPPNTEPVEPWKRAYVYERDGRRCTYCGVKVAFGALHVDHSVSRANRGTNHLNNLRAACIPCNLAKGALNARQFLR